MRADPADMFTGMVPDIWGYRTADRLITQHGAGALNEADRLVNEALIRRDADRVLLMLRARFALVAYEFLTCLPQPRRSLGEEIEAGVAKPNGHEIRTGV
jgi:hypothetical protein